MPNTINTPERADLEPVHRLHSYCARFPSEIAKAAIQQYTRRGDSVYDPFCGSGTSLTAGLLLGRRAIGSDIDVLAGMISRVKCAPASQVAYERWAARFEKRLERSFDAIVKGWWSRDSTPRPGELLKVGGLSLFL